MTLKLTIGLLFNLPKCSAKCLLACFALVIRKKFSQVADGGLQEKKKKSCKYELNYLKFSCWAPFGCKLLLTDPKVIIRKKLKMPVAEKDYLHLKPFLILFDQWKRNPLSFQIGK